MRSKDGNTLIKIPENVFECWQQSQSYELWNKSYSITHLLQMMTSLMVCHRVKLSRRWTCTKKGSSWKCFEKVVIRHIEKMDSPWWHHEVYSLRSEWRRVFTNYILMSIKRTKGHKSYCIDFSIYFFSVFSR